MRLFIALSIVFFSISQAGALTCAPPEGSPKQQISEAYDKSDLVALAVHASPYRHGELLIKAVVKVDRQGAKVDRQDLKNGIGHFSSTFRNVLSFTMLRGCFWTGSSMKLCFCCLFRGNFGCHACASLTVRR